MKLPFNVDLSDKVVALTGAGGAIISQFAEAMALCGAKVALLDINYEAAKAVADRIGENAFAIETNALSKESIIAGVFNIIVTFAPLTDTVYVPFATVAPSILTSAFAIPSIST